MESSSKSVSIKEHSNKDNGTLNKLGSEEEEEEEEEKEEQEFRNYFSFVMVKTTNKNLEKAKYEFLSSLKANKKNVKTIVQNELPTL